MKLNWAVVATVMMCVSIAMGVLPYGWAHNTANATTAVATFLTGTYVYKVYKN